MCSAAKEKEQGGGLLSAGFLLLGGGSMGGSRPAKGQASEERVQWTQSWEPRASGGALEIEQLGGHGQNNKDRTAWAARPSLVPGYLRARLTCRQSSDPPRTPYSERELLHTV